MVKLSAKFKPNSRKERLLIMNNRSFGAFSCTNILLFSFIVIMASIGLTANVHAGWWVSSGLIQVLTMPL